MASEPDLLEATDGVPSHSPDDATRQQFRSKVTLKGVAETLLIPIRARAEDAQAPAPVLGDKYASEIMAKLDFDFNTIQIPGDDPGAIALRTLQFDLWTASFLAHHPTATIIHLGCGLDARAQRMSWSGNVRWIDVDFPEVIALRRQVLPSSFPRQDYRLIGTDVTDATWLEEVPTDRPVGVFMEGFMSYLKEDDSTALVTRLTEKFSEGELFFDCINSMTMSMHRKKPIDALRKAGVDFHSAIDNLKTWEEKFDHLEIVESIRYLEMPGMEKLHLVSRIRNYLLSWIPILRDAVRLVRCRIVSEQRER